MKSTVVTILIIIAVILFGVAGYQWFKTTEEPVQPTETNTQPQESTNSETTNGTSLNNLAALLQSGENKTCTYEFTQDSNTISGAIYISGENMRTNYEITTTDANQNMTGSMIKVGDTMYIWGSQMQQGIKMKYDIEQLQAQYEEDKEKQDQSDQITSPTPFDINKDMGYKCDAWNVDENMFNPPSDVQFIDTSAMMNNVPAMQDQCAICNSLPGDKTACLKQFNCTE